MDEFVHLKAWRKHRQLTLEQVAEQIGSTHASLSRLENGRTEWKRSNLQALAAVYGAGDPLDLLRPPPSGERQDAVPLVGKVGAGGDITRIDTIVDYVDLPPGADGPLEALEVAGESMLPEIQTGDLLFYDPTAPGNPRDLLYRLVVLETEDGRLFVKTLRPGAEPDTFDLISYAEGKRENVRVKSAAKVLFQDRRGRR